MRDGGLSDGPERIGVTALREWITGEREAYSRVFLVEGETTADRIGDAVGVDDALLLPAESGSYDGPATAVRYRGTLREVGDELFLGERGVELQDYVAAGFVQLVGPTVVGLFDAAGREAFLDDAELARRTGVFPSALLDPRVLLANRAALTRPEEIVIPSAIRVDADGRVSVGLQGEGIGSVDDLRTLLSVPLPRDAALEGIGPEGMLAADARSREWLGRYLGATDLMKMLRLANGAARIAGFGWPLLDDDQADAEPLVADPYLLETADGFVLADITTLRRQLLSPATAGVVAAVQTSSSLDVATERVARQLGAPAPEASRLCREAVRALDIHVGRRTDVVSRTAGGER